MYDTPADSSRSSSSGTIVPPLSASPRTHPPLTNPLLTPRAGRCRRWPALPSGPLFSPAPFPLLSASTALIHRHREGCSVARTRASAKWLSTLSRDPFQPLFSFLYTPRHALYPRDTPTFHSPRGFLARTRRGKLETDSTLVSVREDIARLRWTNLKALWALLLLEIRSRSSQKIPRLNFTSY